MLKRARYHSGRRLAIQKEMTRPSKATVIVPADGPKRSTEAKTKVSETEIEAPAVGKFTVADPLTNVSAASMYHWNGSGLCCASTTDVATAARPLAMTMAR